MRFIDKVFDMQFNAYSLSVLSKAFYYMIDSKYRVTKKLDRFLLDQLVNPDDKLKQLSNRLKAKKDDDTIINILNWVTKNIKYQSDDITYDKVEYWASAAETLKQGKDDCLIWNTKLLDSCYNLINIEDINIGDFIVGKDGKLVRVLKKWNKGKLSTKRILLNNGSEIIVTDNHKFLTREGKEILCSELKVGTFLKELDSIKFETTEKTDKNYWYLKGLFIADGWTDTQHKSVFISGKDGFPKEKQKEWVKEYCIKNKIQYTWNKRYIVIHSKELLNDFSNCGRHAIDKHIDRMPQNLENIKSLLDGLKADACIRINKKDICFGTISETLKNQLRVLYRIIGYSVKTSLVQPCRTQFGRNPIWRIYVRNKSIKLKVIGIFEGKEEPVYDIEVEKNEIYLPENDCIVHNCDGINGLVYVLARFCGILPYKLYCAIGTAGGDGHFWCLYYSTDTMKVYSIDGTYYPNLVAINNGRKGFKLDSDRYQKLWYIFNEINIWKVN